MDSSSSFLRCSKLTRCNPETCKLRDQLRFKEIFISTSQPRWRENVVGFNRSRRSRITDDAIKAVQRSCIYNEGYFCHNRLNQLASMLNNTADQLRNLLTSLVPVKVSWFGILPLRTIAMSLVIAWRFFQHYDFMSSNSFLVLTSKLEPSTVFTSIFGFANRNLLQVFTSFFGFANRNLWKVFTSISARLTALRQFSRLTNSIQVDGFIAKSGCGELHFVLLDLGIQEFRFGPRFVRGTISTNGFHIPPRVSARFDWFHLAQNNNGSCIFSAFIIRLISFRGSVVREQNHRSTGSCLFTALEPHQLYSHYSPRLGWIQVLRSSDVLN